MQEVWAARHLTVLHGSYELSWQFIQDVTELAEIIQERLIRLGGSEIPGKPSLWYPDALRSLYQASEVALLTVDAGNDNRNPGLEWDASPIVNPLAGRDPELEWSEEYRSDLINVLRRASSAECTEPRHHVYGLLGMSTAPSGSGVALVEPSMNRIVIDYRKSVLQLYISVAVYFIRRDRNLRILNLGATYGGSFAAEHLPLWLPNWTTLGDEPNKSKIEQEACRFGRVLLHTWDARGSPFITLFPAHWLADLKIEEIQSNGLSLRGIRVGTLQKLTSSAIPYGTFHYEAPNEPQQYLTVYTLDSTNGIPTRTKPRKHFAKWQHVSMPMDSGAPGDILVALLGGYSLYVLRASSSKDAGQTCFSYVTPVLLDVLLDDKGDVAERPASKMFRPAFGRHVNHYLKRRQERGQLETFRLV